MTRVILIVVAALVPSLLSAQSNDAIRIAVLEQQIASLQAELRMCHGVKTPTVIVQPTAAVAGPLSLAEAAEAAKAIKHDWALPTGQFVPGVRVVPVDTPQIAADGSLAGTGTTQLAAPAQAAASTGTRGEQYWKDRMRALQTRLDADQTFTAEATARAATLDKRVHMDPLNVDAIHDRLILAGTERQWQDALAESRRLQAAVVNDKRAIGDLQEEARRAGALPGWLTLP